MIKTLIKLIAYPAVVLRRFFLKKRHKYQMQVVDNLFEVLVEDPVIRVGEFDGIFKISPRSDLFYRAVMQKCYEPFLVAKCLEHLDPSKDVIDAGANIGFYSVLFAKNISNGSRVLAIEPTRRALERLYCNLEMNNVAEKVKVFGGVVSDKQGFCEIKTIPNKEEYSTLGEMNLASTVGENYVSETVRSETLDCLVDKETIKPGFIKIDCEGAEHSVLKGAEKTLKTYRPILLIEVHHSLLQRQGSSILEVVNLIKAHNYDVLKRTNNAPSKKKCIPDTILCFPLAS